jgi:hypothetical protein
MYRCIHRKGFGGFRRGFGVTVVILVLVIAIGICHGLFLIAITTIRPPRIVAPQLVFVQRVDGVIEYSIDVTMRARHEEADVLDLFGKRALERLGQRWAKRKVTTNAFKDCDAEQEWRVKLYVSSVR